MKNIPLFVSLLLLGSEVASLAASLTFGAATNITGDSDVVTTGTLVDARSLGANVPATTVNGVTFEPLNVANNVVNTASAGIFTLDSPGKLFSNDTAFTSAVSSYQALSAAYRTLLISEISTTGTGTAPAPTITLTISGLTVGQSYLFQFFVNDPRNRNDAFSRETAAAAGGTVSLQHNVANADGSPGQYALGTFMADSTSQVIVFTGTATGLTGVSTASTQIQAFQLRAVPEPSTCLSLAAGVGLLMSARRRRRSS